MVSASAGTPLISARVDAGGDAEAVAVFTDTEGRFAINPGRSRTLTVRKPGFLPLTIELDGSAPLTAALIKAGAIAGRITDQRGEPLRGQNVTAELLDGASTRVVATVLTDDLGDYRLAGLAEGRYVVGIRSGAPLPPGVQRPAPFYFPAAPNRGQAITVATGEERWAIDVTWIVPELIRLDGQPLPTPRPPRPAGGGAIRGRVFSSDGRPLREATVRLEAAADPDARVVRQSQIVTDDQGRYAFEETEAGTYFVRASKTGFVPLQFGQRDASQGAEPIEVRRGDVRNNADITLPRFSAVTGRVLDDLGEPVEGAVMRVSRIGYAAGRRRLVAVNGLRPVSTDDRGVFRVYDLPPDEYVVCAEVGQVVRRNVPGVGTGIADAAPSADRPGFATSCFPSTLNPGEAQRVALGPAEDVPGIDVALQRTPTARISGRLVDAEGNPLSDGLIMAPSRRSGVLAAAPVAATIDDEGNFEFRNVAPGEYVVQASVSSGDPFDEGESASRFVTVIGEDVTGLLMQLTRGSRVRGRVSFDGTPPGAALFGVDLQALPLDMDQTPQNVVGGFASARLDEDGTFVMTGLTGPRVLRLQSPRWRLKAVLLNGNDVTDMPLMFGGADASLDGVEVVLTDRSGTIGGRALDARRRTVADATVIAFPTDRGQWTEVSRFMTSALSAKDGAFTLRNLPPGDYYVAATTAVTGADWRDPELLDALVPVAVRITLDDNVQSADVTVAPR